MSILHLSRVRSGTLGNVQRASRGVETDGILPAPAEADFAHSICSITVSYLHHLQRQGWQITSFLMPSGIYRLPDLIPKSYTLKRTGESSFYQSPLMTWRALFLNWSCKEGAVGRPGLETSPRDSDMPGQAPLAQDSISSVHFQEGPKSEKDWNYEDLNYT